MLPSSSWLYASQKGGKRVITLVFIDESYRLWGAHRKGHAATDGSKRGKKWPAKWARRKAGSATWFVQSVYLDKWVLQDFHHMSCAAAAPGRTIKYLQGLSGEDRWWRLVAESLICHGWGRGTWTTFYFGSDIGKGLRDSLMWNYNIFLQIIYVRN